MGKVSESGGCWVLWVFLGKVSGTVLSFQAFDLWLLERKVSGCCFCLNGMRVVLVLDNLGGWEGL